MDMLTMNYIWSHHKDLIPHGVELCDYLDVDFVGVKFSPAGSGRYNKKYIVIPDLQLQASKRDGIIKFYKHATLTGLLQKKKGKPGFMSYSDFMNTYVWAHNFYCTKALLDI